MFRHPALVLIAAVAGCFAIPGNDNALEDGSPLCVFDCPGSWADDSGSSNDEAVIDYFCDVADECDDSFQRMFDSVAECEDDLDERLADCDISDDELRDCATNVYDAASDSGADECEAWYGTMYLENACEEVIRCLIYGPEDDTGVDTGDTGDVRGPPAPAESEGWREAVGARLRADARSFRTEGRGFTATTPAMYGRFDADGAALTAGNATVHVRGASFGRGEADPLLRRETQLGACTGEFDVGGECVRRLEWAAEGITEWWSPTDAGFEQGWIVDARPAGRAQLSIDVEVDGARAALGEEGLTLVGADGGLLRVSDPIAWDASGKELPVWYALIDGGYRIWVEDSSAEYPIEVDPVYTAATTSLTEGSDDYFGYSVCGAGDVNGDGYDDVIVGAPYYNSDDGRAYVYHGSASGVNTTSVTTLDELSDDYFGYSVSGAGDVNGDGYDDVIVGAYNYNGEDGAVYVYHGSSSGISSTAATSLPYTSANERFGWSVAGAGLVNDDDYADVIVGAYAYSSSTGRAYVYYGSASGISTAGATTLSGSSSSSFGYSVAGAGDVNGDGLGDVIVGGFVGSSYRGYASVYHGGVTAISSSATTTLTGGSTGDYLGFSVAGAGDVNGDDYDDVVVGAPYASSTNGQALVYYGSSAGVSSTGSTTITGSNTDEYLGRAVAGAGDVDADGYDDVVIGAPYYSTSIGRAYVHLGSATGIGTSPTSTLTGLGTSGYFGYSVSSAGSVEGDLGSDVIVGAFRYNSDNGYAYVHHGYSTVDADGDLSYAHEDCDESDSDIHPTATETIDDGIDQDCDGVDACYTDDDDDNFGTTVVSDGSSLDCDGGAGSPVTTDCDDADEHTFPGAAPNDSASACMKDDDEDDYGDDAASGTVIDGTDCDDTRSTSYPGAIEVVADGRDQDCDGNDSCYEDDDGDDYGTSTVVEASSCSNSGVAANASDCDDGDADINPGEREIIDDGIDQDCDDVDRCYRDDDDDEYGDTGEIDGSSLDCASGTGAGVSGDCDDGDDEVNPGAAEVPADFVDQDCDGDELCYADDDEDGYAADDGSTTTSDDLDCSDDGESRSVGSDCDDGDDDVYPGRTEYCNNADDDCNGAVDDVDEDNLTAYYRDADGDGYGDPGDVEYSCDQPNGYVENPNDCNDGDASIVDPVRWYRDDDGDGYGIEDIDREDCDQPAGYAREYGDCDDGDAQTYPGASEYCNDDRDYDCDGDSVDNEDAVDAETWYADEDGDGYGTDESVTGCERPENGADQGGDCDDDSPGVNPGQEETDKSDGVDQDCDGKVEKSWIAGRTIFSGCSSTGSGAPGALAVLLAVALLSRRRAVVLAGLLAASPAVAGGRYDAHGFMLVPNDGDALDLMSTWRAEEYRQWSFGGTILGEYSAGGVAAYEQYDDDVDSEALQEGYVALNLGGIFALSKGIALSVSTPGYLGQDSSWGDLRVAIPFNAAFPREKPAGLTFGIIPYGDIPTGDELRWRGNRGMGGGITFATGWNAPRWTLAANVGGFYQPLIENMNLRGGPHLLAALGTGFLVSDNIALRGEVNYRPSLVEQEPYDAESPGEIVLSAKGTYAWGLNWTAGMGTAWSGGVGAAPIRLFVGGGAALGKEAINDQDGDKVPDPIDACKTDPEVVNQYKDRDGCPDKLGDLTVKVVDEDQHVVPDATATSSSAVGQSDATGTALLNGLIPGIVTGTVTHPVYDIARFDVDPLVEGPNEKIVTLRFKTVPVTVTAVGPDGLPTDARVRFEGPTDFGYRFLGADGTATFDLRPGDWRMLISTENGGTERREVKLTPGQTEAVQVGVNFRPAMAVVDTAKREVLIREQIYFDVGQATIRPESMPIVAQLSNLLLDHPEILQVEVQGHTDSDGDDKRNLDLSQRRVEAVCLALIQSGVGVGRLVPRGYGESKPIAINATEEGKALNRRVQFVIIAMDESAAPTKEGN